MFIGHWGDRDVQNMIVFLGRDHHVIIMCKVRKKICYVVFWVFFFERYYIKVTIHVFHGSNFVIFVKKSWEVILS